MKKKIIALSGCLIVLAGTALYAGPPHHRHHRDKGEGVRLATDIVNLVGASLNVLTGGPTVVVTPPPPPPPAPVVVAPPPPPPPAPVVVAPPPPPPPPPPPVVVPTYSYGWYNGYWVPCYNGWYYWNSTWYWGDPGPRPPRPPAWRPDPRRPAPPAPPRHHGHNPKPAPRHHATPPPPHGGGKGGKAIPRDGHGGGHHRGGRR